MPNRFVMQLEKCKKSGGALRVDRRLHQTALASFISERRIINTWQEDGKAKLLRSRSVRPRPTRKSGANED
jgi:hypothetical protein